jgi:hypothetical protein
MLIEKVSAGMEANGERRFAKNKSNGRVNYPAKQKRLGRGTRLSLPQTSVLQWWREQLPHPWARHKRKVGHRRTTECRSRGITGHWGVQGTPVSVSKIVPVAAFPLERTSVTSTIPLRLASWLPGQLTLALELNG